MVPRVEAATTNAESRVKERCDMEVAVKPRTRRYRWVGRRVGGRVACPRLRCSAVPGAVATSEKTLKCRPSSAAVASSVPDGSNTTKLSGRRCARKWQIRVPVMTSTIATVPTLSSTLLGAASRSEPDEPAAMGADMLTRSQSPSSGDGSPAHHELSAAADLAATAEAVAAASDTAADADATARSVADSVCTTYSLPTSSE
mmetsp:Transcript_14034/g.44179  ORF Transcript_14034/g.44179 Transcript_14034/m.44179 type:complete len:201 (+) Transcript_14034:1379-1981(+)